MTKCTVYYLWLFWISAAALAATAVGDDTAPVISHISQDVVASLGDSVELNCTVEHVGELSVSWAKIVDNSSVVLSMRGMLSLRDKRHNITVLQNSGQDNATYSFRLSQIEPSDMGTYECQVIVSSMVKITKKLNLLIRTPPVIAESTPKNRLVTEGQNLEVTCQANGYPKPTISWERVGNAIMPAGGHVVIDATLRIKEVHRLDRGGYNCIAQNGEGQPDKRLVRIDVEFGPEIYVPLVKVPPNRSNAADLECMVQGYPAPAVAWFRNGVQLQSSRHHEISNTASSSETTTSVLRIDDVSEEDYGDYFCNATNKLGHAGARLNLFKSYPA